MPTFDLDNYSVDLTDEQVQIALDWADDLMTGNRRQGKSRLTSEHDGVRYYCCLGVLSDRAVNEGVVSERRVSDTSPVIEYGRYGEQAELPVEVQEWSGLSNTPELLVPEHLRYKLVSDEGDHYYGSGWVSAISLNDEYGFTFAEIGECIKNSLGKAV